MTIYSDYHKQDHERKKLAGHKKVSFLLNPDESIFASQVRANLKSSGNPKTNKKLYMEAIERNNTELNELKFLH